MSTGTLKTTAGSPPVPFNNLKPFFYVALEATILCVYVESLANERLSSYRELSSVERGLHGVQFTVTLGLA